MGARTAGCRRAGRWARVISNDARRRPRTDGITGFHVSIHTPGASSMKPRIRRMAAAPACVTLLAACSTAHAELAPPLRLFCARSQQSRATHAGPFAPRSGEKVVRQHRMRGRGRWGACAVSVVRKRRFIGCCRRRSTKAPLIRGCRRTFSPSPRGEGTGMRFLGCAVCMLAKAPAFPSPRAAGRRWCGSTG